MHYSLDSARSFINWRGFLRSGYCNEGRLPVESRLLRVRDGLPYAGIFEMPLGGLENFNLPEKGLRELFIRELQSGAFFDIARYPVLRFELDGFRICGRQADGGLACRIRGGLELLGKRHPLSFPALIRVEAGHFWTTARMTIDLEPWGIGNTRRSDLDDEEIVESRVELELSLFARQTPSGNPAPITAQTTAIS